MPTHLINKLKKCSNSRRSATLAKKQPKLCRSNWCIHCSKPTTNLIVAEAIKKFEFSNPQLYHTTAVIGPTKDPIHVMNLAIKILHKMAELNIECIGSLEFADPRFTNGFDKLNQKKPFYKSLHFANAHIHFINNQFFKVDDELLRSVLFCYDHQLYQQLERKGKYKDQSRIDFITRVIEYGRKRESIINTEWFKSIQDSIQQLSFMIHYGEVYVWNYQLNEFKVINNNDVLKAESLNQSWRKGSKTLDNLSDKVENIREVALNGKNNQCLETDQENQKEFIETVIPHSKSDPPTQLQIIKESIHRVTGIKIDETHQKSTKLSKNDPRTQLQQIKESLLQVTQKTHETKQESIRPLNHIQQNNEIQPQIQTNEIKQSKKEDPMVILQRIRSKQPIQLPKVIIEVEKPKSIFDELFEMMGK